MTRPSAEGHIHGVPVLIIRARDEERIRAQRAFMALDMYWRPQAPDPKTRGVEPVHEYEIGGLFDMDQGTVVRRIIVRRMGDRRAVFTDEQLIAQMGEERAREYLDGERDRRKTRRSRRSNANREAAREAAIALSQPGKCEICQCYGPLRWDRRGYLCSTCNSMLLLAHDSPERLRAAAAYAERVIGRAAAKVC